MKLLLDTHVLIWALTDSPHLCSEVRNMIISPENQVCFSTASLWEVAIKNQKSPDKCPYLETDLLAWCREAQYECLSVTPAHILAIRNLHVLEGYTLANLDPFDRLLLAQAKSERSILLSHDRNFSNYQEDCLHLF